MAPKQPPSNVASQSCSGNFNDSYPTLSTPQVYNVIDAFYPPSPEEPRNDPAVVNAEQEAPITDTITSPPLPFSNHARGNLFEHYGSTSSPQHTGVTGTTSTLGNNVQFQTQDELQVPEGIPIDHYPNQQYPPQAQHYNSAIGSHIQSQSTQRFNGFSESDFSSMDLFIGSSQFALQSDTHLLVPEEGHPRSYHDPGYTSSSGMEQSTTSFQTNLSPPFRFGSNYIRGQAHLEDPFVGDYSHHGFGIGSAPGNQSLKKPRSRPSHAKAPRTPNPATNRSRTNHRNDQILNRTPVQHTPISEISNTTYYSCEPSPKKFRADPDSDSLSLSSSYQPSSVSRPLLPRPDNRKTLDPVIILGIQRWRENNPEKNPTDDQIKVLADLGAPRGDYEEIRAYFREITPIPSHDSTYWSGEQPMPASTQPSLEQPTQGTSLDEAELPAGPVNPGTSATSLVPMHKCRVEGCLYESDRKGERDKHEKTHDEPQWKCPYQGCNSVLSRKDKLRDHIKAKHKKNPLADLEGFLRSYKPDEGDDGSNGPSKGSRTAKPGTGKDHAPAGGGGSTQNSSGNCSSQSRPGSGQTDDTTMSQSSDDTKPDKGRRDSREWEKSLLRSFRYIDLEDRMDTGTSGPHADASVGKSHTQTSNSLPFRVLRRLGAGAWGNVEEVDLGQGRLRACKVIHLDKKQDIRRRVEKEVDIMKRLRHPNIINLAGTLTTRTTISLLLDPVAACDLKQFMHLPPLDERLTQSNFSLWFCELASALKYLHSTPISVIHGDLKPANILVFNAHVLITDFGSAARSNDPSSPPKPGPFTKIYAAPELLTGTSTIHQSADIFSLGCVFLEMTTVLLQFSLASLEASRSGPVNGHCDSSFHTHLSAVRTWIGKLRARSNPKRKFVNKILDWCLSMLTYDPSQRPDARALAQDVQHSECSTCSTMSLTEGRQEGIHYCAKCTTPDISRKFVPRSPLMNSELPSPEYCIEAFDKDLDPTERLWAIGVSGSSLHVMHAVSVIKDVDDLFLCPSGYHTLKAATSGAF